MDVVSGDDSAGGARRSKHLVDLGHTRIAHLAGTGRAGELRTEGYREQMRRHGLGDHIRVEVSDRSEAGDLRAAEALLSTALPRPRFLPTTTTPR